MEEQEKEEVSKWVIVGKILAYFITGLKVAFLISIPIGIWYYFHVYCDADNVNAYEIRFYTAIFLTMVFLTMFGVLRIYNAIVRNTASTTVFAKKLGSFTNEMGKFIQTLNSTVKNQSNEAAVFEKAVKLFTETIKDLFNANYTKR